MNNTTDSNETAARATSMTGAERVPVTIVCGAAKAGKTALIDHLIGAAGDDRFAVIVDATNAAAGSGSGGGRATIFQIREPVESFLTQPIGDDDRDALRRDLWRELSAGGFDRVFIETGLRSEPDALVAAMQSNVPGYTLADALRLDTVMTVIDCARMQDDYASTDALPARVPGVADADDRTVANVVAAQIECADVLVLNRSDTASPGLMREVNDIVGVLNPDASRIETCFGAIPATTADRRDAAVADRRPGWLRHLERPLPMTEVYPVARLLYQRRRPFHPERLATFLDTDWPWVLRTRGQFWVANRPEWAGDIQQAGRSVSIRPFGYWWASAAVGGRTPDDPELVNELNSLWHSVYGDRRQHIAILGIDLDIVAMAQRLDDCLLTDAELARGWDGWRDLADPWPAWR